MQTERFSVSNVKCQGCANNIRVGVSSLAGVQEVTVDVTAGAVVVSGDGLDRAMIASKLAELGYPETAATA